MDPLLEELYGPLHGIKFHDQKVPTFSNHSFMNPLELQELNLSPTVPNPSFVNPTPLVLSTFSNHSFMNPLELQELNLSPTIPNPSFVYPTPLVLPTFSNHSFMNPLELQELNLSPTVPNPSFLNPTPLVLPTFSNHSFMNPLELQELNLSSTVPNPSFVNPTPLVLPNLDVNSVVESQVSDTEGSLNEDCDFSDVVLKYVSQVLMEEDEGEKHHTYHEPSVVEAAEKSLYEALGQSYPPSQNVNKLPSVNHDNLNGSGGSRFTGYSWCGDPFNFSAQTIVDFTLSSSNPLSYSSSDSSGRWAGSGLVESPVSALSVSDIFNDSKSMLQFQKGHEEASKFLPRSSLLVNLEDDNRGKKHVHPEELQSEEGRSHKQSAINLVSDDADVRSEMFDKVLLCSGGKNDAAIRESIQSKLNKNVPHPQVKGSNSGKGRGKKGSDKRDVVDLRSLLSLCAQAVASDDHRSANDMLGQIRRNSSPNGDGNQRMAHYFANGLEARLAGVGTQIYSSLVPGPSSAVDMLRAYHVFLATCPFKKMANFFSNRTIMAMGEKATCIHIIDLGIVYGFQWPGLIQRLSSRPGGPPKLRITGVDLPQPGFRPAKRVEETGRRLRDYAESFNVPFEFNAVAKKWESLTIEDLKIQKDEVLVVNCMFRFQYIPDETVIVDCPRDIVLNLIRQLNPAVFTQGIVNGAFNSPFFIARFRQALFHFSTQFDMLETVMPGETAERMLMEREIFGRQAMNVIACEGLERTQRPETYKQWQVRHERAGFKQMQLDHETVEMVKKRVKSVYHKNYCIDVDGNWLLQGWKGRIVYALTNWKLAN